MNLTTAGEIELANALALADWPRVMRHIDRQARLAGTLTYDSAGNPGRTPYPNELDYMAEARGLLERRRG